MDVHWRPLDNPLGDEDAAKRDKTDVHHAFVDVRDLIVQPYQVSEDIEQIRVVVGKKGSGKTHILRYIEDETGKSGRTVIFGALNDNAIPAHLERQFETGTDRPHARSHWSRLWRIVIAISILSRFLTDQSAPKTRKSLFRFLDSRGVGSENRSFVEARQSLVAHFEQHFSAGIDFKLASLRDVADPGIVLHRILEPIHTLSRLLQFLDKTDLASLESDVASLVKHDRPIHVIIDGVDEVSWRQPRMWLDFQVGLFDAIFFFHEAQRNTNDIVITAAIRNFVFVAARESPHADRIRNLLSLNWDPRSARMFLNRRLQQISGLRFVDSDRLKGDQRPLAGWLGFSKVQAKRRSVPEDVERYLLRHTRLSPRNIIRLFNLLCRHKAQLYLSGEDFTEKDFRAVVEEVGNDVADLMLKTAAEEIIAFTPDISTTVSTVRNEGVVNWVATELGDTIREFGKEVLSRDEYEYFLETFLRRILPDEACTDSGISRNSRLAEAILWRSNVIAFRPQKDPETGWIFSWSPQQSLPSKPDMAGFHSSLIVRCELEVSEEYGPVF